MMPAQQVLRVARMEPRTNLEKKSLGSAGKMMKLNIWQRMLIGSRVLENGGIKFIQEDFQHSRINSGIKSDGVNKEIDSGEQKIANFIEEWTN